MNSVSIIGRLVADPELKHLQNGTAVCKIRVAVDRAGDKQDDGTFGAGFFDVTFWSKTAEVVAQYLVKGRQVGVQGELRHHTWKADDGTNRSRVEVNGRNVTFVGSKNDGNGGGGPPERDDEDIPF